jgi:hypothetical protein
VGGYLDLCVDREKHNLEEIINLIITNEEKDKIMRSIAQDFIDQGDFK